MVKRYIERIVDTGLSERMYFIIGIGPLRSEKSAKWMKDKLFGTVMPDSIIKRMEGSNDQIQEGADICAELIESFREIEGVHGAHLMAPRNLSAIPETVKQSGITI